MAFGKLGSKLTQYFAFDPDDEYDDPVDETNYPAQPTPPVQPTAPSNQGQSAYHGNKVVAMTNPQEKTAKIVVYEPRIYSDGKEIGTHLLNNKAVIVNFSRIDGDDATRIVDFLTGTVYAIKGEIQRIGAMIFLVTPANFEIDGSLAQTLAEDHDFDLRD